MLSKCKEFLILLLSSLARAPSGLMRLGDSGPRMGRVEGGGGETEREKMRERERERERNFLFPTI